MTTAETDAAPPAQNDHSVCPACGTGKLRRSRRRTAIEVIRSWFGYFPYRCSECRHRMFWKDDRPLNRLAAKPDKRPESRRRARQRTLREVLFYTLAVAGLLALLYYILREPPQ